MKPDQKTKLIEKTLAVDATRKNIGRYSQSEGVSYFTDGHVLLVGPELAYLFSDRKPFLNGPNIFGIMSNAFDTCNETFFEELPFTAKKGQKITAVYNGSFKGIRFSKTTIGDIEPKEKHIAFDVTYINFLANLGFNRLFWDNNNGRALAIRQHGEEINHDLMAIVMPMIM